MAEDSKRPENNPEEYKQNLSSLKTFIDSFDSDEISGRQELLSILNLHGNELRSVLSFKGNVSKKMGEYLGATDERGLHEIYTAQIKSPNLRAKWFSEHGYVEISVSLKEHFSETDRPYTGFLITVPDGSNENNWLVRARHLIETGIGGEQVEALDFNKMDEDESRFFATKYKEAVGLIIDFAENETE